MGQREFYIDRLRSTMTVVIVLFHTAISLGAAGGAHSAQTAGSPRAIAEGLLVVTNEAYFMGFFFLFAGYFTPASLERKGYGRFLLDRSLRLGVPLVAYGMVLGPLSVALASFGKGSGFWPAIHQIVHQRRWINGPLWFAEALLIFDLTYAGWRACTTSPLSRAERHPTQVPSPRWWLIAALLTGVASLSIRQWIPAGRTVFGLQPGYFAGYIVLFAAGIASWRHDWLRQLNWHNARAGLIASVAAWPVLPAGVAISKRFDGGDGANVLGGMSAAAILFALWEPFVAWGAVAFWLLIFRDRFNRPSTFWAWLSRRAYAVYILHAPVIAGILVCFPRWTASTPVKLAVAGPLACAATWLLADPLVRLPGARRVV